MTSVAGSIPHNTCTPLCICKVQAKEEVSKTCLFSLRFSDSGLIVASWKRPGRLSNKPLTLLMCVKCKAPTTLSGNRKRLMAECA